MPRAGSAKRKKQEQAKKNFARSSVKIEMGPAPPRKVPSKKSAFPPPKMQPGPPTVRSLVSSGLRSRKPAPHSVCELCCERDAEEVRVCECCTGMYCKQCVADSLDMYECNSCKDRVVCEKCLIKCTYGCGEVNCWECVLTFQEKMMCANCRECRDVAV